MVCPKPSPTPPPAPWSPGGRPPAHGDDEDDDPAFEAIPYAYTLAKLHELAPLFWADGASSNCTILVRDAADAVSDPSAERTTCTPPPSPPFMPSGLASSPIDDHGGDDNDDETAPSGLQRPGRIPVLSYKLHRDYLAPQSQLFRRFFSSPLTPPPTSTDHAGAFPSNGSCAWGFGAGRAQVVPPLTTATHTTLLLTLPDPRSFALIVHYLYWGRADVVYTALCEGKVGWKGLVNNVQFLGLDAPIKAACGRFWKHHVAAGAGCKPPSPN